MSKNKVLSGLSWSFAEKLLTDLVNTVITIVLARLLMPEDYGLVALVTIFINISLIFVSTGLGTAVIQNKDADDEQIATIFYVNLILGILIYIVLFFCAPLIASSKGNTELVALVRVLGLRIPITSVYNIQHAHIKKRMEFKKFFYSSFLGTVLAGAVGISMAYMGYGAWALVFSTLTDSVVDSVVLFFTTKWLPKPALKIKKSMKMIDFGLKILVKEFISRTYTQVRGLIIGYKYTAADLAYNTKGQKFPQMFNEIVDSTVIRVMLPVLSEQQDEKHKMQETVKVSYRMFMFVVAPIMIGLIATADRFIPLLLTNNWIDCVPFLQAYCVVYLLYPISKMDERAIEACGMGGTLIKKQVLTTTFSVVCIVISTVCFDSAIYLIFGLIVSTLFETIVTVNLSSKIIGYSFLEHRYDVRKTIAVSAVMGVAVYFIGLLPLSDLLALLAQIFAGVILYAALSILAKDESALLLLNLLKGKK